MSNRQIVSIAVGLPLAAVFIFLTWYLQAHPVGRDGFKTITVASTTVYVVVVDTEEAREKGLSGKRKLPKDEGMLFVFPSEGTYSFWMKDMNFSIDMLWIATDGTIVHIAPDVSPDTYPKTFVSEKPAKYVLELTAGFSRAHTVSVGDSVDLK